MNDEWGDRARPDDSPARPPQARRVDGREPGTEPRSEAERWGDEDAPNAAPPRKAGGMVVAIVVGALLLVGAVGTAVYLIVDGQNPPPPVAFGPPPGGGFGPGGFGPGMPGPGAPPEPDWQPADEDTARQIRAALRKLGRALQKPDFDPDDHFDVADMAATATVELPRQPRWGQTAHDQLDAPFGGPRVGPNPNAGPPLDPQATLRGTLRNARPQWRKREWEKPDIRSIIRANNGQADNVLAMVWQARPDGPPVRWLWTFTPARDALGGPGGFGGPGGPPGAEPMADGAAEWKICQWEDLDCGLRGTDELVLDLIGSAERRWDLYGFRQLADLHRQAEDGEFETAEQRLSQLARTRPVGRFADLCDLADARLKMRRGDSGGAAVLLNGVNERQPNMTVLFALMSEGYIRHGEPANAVDDCRRYLKHYGASADVHALLAEALRATGVPDEAREHLNAALKEQPEHPRALTVLRRMPAEEGAKDGGEFARRVIGSPKFLGLYKRLSPELMQEGDWKSLRPLVEEYHARRPDDLDALRLLVQARAETEDADAALDLYLRYVPQVPRHTRWGMTYALTSAIHTGDGAKALYARLPDDHADELFPRLVQAVDTSARGNVRPQRKDETQRAVAELVALHAARRPDSPAVRLHEAKALLRDKKWAEAEAKLAGIKTEPDPDGDRDSTAWEVEATRTDVYFALKKWGAALAGKRGARAFNDLADRCEDDKTWADLTALVAAAKKAGTKLPPGTAEYWSGVALAGDGKHAAAVAEFRKAVAASPPRKPRYDPDDDDDYDGSLPRSMVVPHLARSLVKGGKAADALALLETEDFVQPALYAYALTADGQTERAAKYLLGAVEGNRFFAPSAYRDPDFGPLLNDKPEFAEFRGRYPKPEELPKDD